VSKKYEDLSSKIRKQSDHLQEKRRALESGKAQQPPSDLLVDRIVLGGQSPAGSNTPAQTNNDRMVACHNIPYPKNEHLFGRQDELVSIRKHLDVDRTSPRFQSFALYGSGGIGKTQLALAYAHEQVQKQVQAVIWINCETGLSIARSFAAVSDLLELDGRIADENSDQNRTLVMSWLRKTSEIPYSPSDSNI
jgi:ATP-dependent Clp protease ATP-binding subunit ClpA